MLVLRGFDFEGCRRSLSACGIYASGLERVLALRSAAFRIPPVYLRSRKGCLAGIAECRGRNN